MPSKFRPDDWDRLFAPTAPRRGGPLRTFINLLIAIAIVGLIGYGALWANTIRQQRFEQAVATATAAAATALPQQTATVLAELNATATLQAIRTATAIAQQSPTLTTSVLNGGNVRAQPVSGQPLDQVNAGETVQLLGKTTDASWFRISYTRNGQTITGWVSRTLLKLDPAVEARVP